MEIRFSLSPIRGLFLLVNYKDGDSGKMQTRLAAFQFPPGDLHAAHVNSVLGGKVLALSFIGTSTHPAQLVLYRNTDVVEIHCECRRLFIPAPIPHTDEWDALSSSQSTSWDALFDCCWCWRSKVYNEVVGSGGEWRISHNFIPSDGSLNRIGFYFIFTGTQLRGDPALLYALAKCLKK